MSLSDQRTWLFVGALVAGAGVALGAFGAHGLQSYLRGQSLPSEEVTRLLGTWDTAVRYQMYHALGMLLVGCLALQRPSLALGFANGCFLLGVVIFSGCLYALVLTGVKVLGAIVPLGGVLMIAGWLLLAAACWK